MGSETESFSVRAAIAIESIGLVAVALVALELAQNRGGGGGGQTCARQRPNPRSPLVKAGARPLLKVPTDRRRRACASSLRVSAPWLRPVGRTVATASRYSALLSSSRSTDCSTRSTYSVTRVFVTSHQSSADALRSRSTSSPSFLTRARTS